VCEYARCSLEIGDEQRVLIRLKGMGVRLFVHSELVELASYLIYDSLDISREIMVRGYESVLDGHLFGIYCVDANVDIDLFQPAGTV
jgi:hypothetical protein